ncbi:MAG: hypothetical protein J5873_01470 [Bacteroidales bacterium]|nr:hypothetical protein [Bacteroidales bacterium]
MKAKSLKAVCLLLMASVFVGCDKDDNTQGGGAGGNGGNTDGVSIKISEPQWNGDEVTYSVTVDIKDATKELKDAQDQRGGGSFGIGYFPVGAESGEPKYFNGDAVSEKVSGDKRSFVFRSTFRVDNRKQARAYVYVGKVGAEEAEYVYGASFYVEPQAPGGDGYSVTGIEEVSHTDTSITLSARIVGDLSSAAPFAKASCGFIYCPESEGVPVFKEGAYIDCTASAFANQGKSFSGTITGLQPDQRYNVMPFLRMTPESELIVGDWRTFTTTNGGGGGNHDTNWIRIDKLSASDTFVSYTVTGYIDSGDPIAIGACYNETGNPTLNDKVYNALEHLSELTMTENPDGSRTVSGVISALKPQTTYYFRAFMRWSNGKTVFDPEIVSVVTSGK